MTFELSTQVKILVLVALVLAAGAVGMLMLHNNSTSETAVVPVTHPAKAPAATRPHPAPAIHKAAAVSLDANLPVPLRNALTHSRTVVAVVYAPGDRADKEVVAAARQGASMAGVGFVALNVRSEKVAGATAAWMRHVSEPAVVVVGRPGKILAEIDGYADSTMVAQAVVDAR
jgi:hypothetical protein